MGGLKPPQPLPLHGPWSKQVFCDLQMPEGPEHYQLSNAQPPGLIVYQMPGVCVGGCSQMELIRTSALMHTRYLAEVNLDEASSPGGDPHTWRDGDARRNF